jgi:hypothetical protein
MWIMEQRNMEVMQQWGFAAAAKRYSATLPFFSTTGPGSGVKLFVVPENLLSREAQESLVDH